MQIIPIFIWISTFVFTIITLLPFAYATFTYHWGIRAVSAILMILGWVIVIQNYIN